ncbi:MAG TPA: alanine racemase, partial [Stackebrandtia sp.]|uniref:alanine racemase n=1 Tax=Stackebrandtia sp. TaxID=2023065 RepID=UPI002D51D7FC
MIPIPAAIAAELDTLASPACAYLYDTRVLAERVDQLRAALPADSAVYYAMKANRHPRLLARAAGACDGIEVASEGELAAAVDAGAAALLFGGPAKTDAALNAALDCGVDCVINVESLHELRRVDHLARRHRGVATIALRVNRAARTPEGSHRMTGVPTPFGIDETLLPQAIEAANGMDGVRLSGLHLHAVSNNLDAAEHARFVRDGLGFAEAVSRRCGSRWDTVNVGGGLGVDYAGARRFDLDALAAGLEG